MRRRSPCIAEAFFELGMTSRRCGRGGSGPRRRHGSPPCARSSALEYDWLPGRRGRSSRNTCRSSAPLRSSTTSKAGSRSATSRRTTSDERSSRCVRTSVARSASAVCVAPPPALHGVVGEAFGGSGLTNIASAMKDFCTTGAMAEIDKPGNCAHGIGHALMFSTGDEVDRALKRVSRLRRSRHAVLLRDRRLHGAAAAGTQGDPARRTARPVRFSIPTTRRLAIDTARGRCSPISEGTAKGWSWRAEVLRCGNASAVSTASATRC